MNHHRYTCAPHLPCWRRFLRILWTARRSNQSILKEINPEYSLGGLMLKLKLQYFGHLMQRAQLLERPWSWERLKPEGEEDYRGWDGWMASLIQCTWVWCALSEHKLWEMGKDREAWSATVHGVTKSRIWLSDWTTTTMPTALCVSRVCRALCGAEERTPGFGS